MRQRKLTPEVIDDILTKMACGSSMAAACRSHDISHTSWMDAVGKDSELADRYARARTAGIDAQADEMHDLEMQVLRGEVDANSFRAAMDARKWRMARQAPKKYGDKVQQEISGPDGGPVRGEVEIVFVDPRDKGVAEES